MKATSSNNNIQWDHKVQIQGLSEERETWLYLLLTVEVPCIPTPGRGALPSVFSVLSTLNTLINEYLVLMARSSSGVKEELEMSTSGDLGTGNIEQSQEQLVRPEVTDRGSWSLRGIQRHPRAEQKPAGYGSAFTLRHHGELRGTHGEDMITEGKQHRSIDACS